jgi:hypothetical protein
MSGHPTATLLLDAIFVAFLWMEIVFSCFMCVKLRNKGPSYNQVVQEMAAVKGFGYPETLQEVATFRCDFNDNMMLRMRKRQAHEHELEAAAAATSGTSSSSLGEEGGNIAAAALTVSTATPTTLDARGGDVSDATVGILCSQQSTQTATIPLQSCHHQNVGPVSGQLLPMDVQ